MGNGPLIRPDFPEETDLIVNPVFDSHFFFRKNSSAYFEYNDLGKKTKVYNTISSFPLLVPEAYCMTSLELHSDKLSRGLKEKMKEYDKTRSLRSEVMLSKLYNRDQNLNRAVSRGEYSFNELSSEIFKLYRAALEMDIRLLPSISRGEKIYNPSRWFYTRDEESDFKANINYNYCITYVRKEDLDKSEKVEADIHDEFTLYEFTGHFIHVKPETADVWPEKIKLHTFRDPSNIFKGGDAEYYHTRTFSVNTPESGDGPYNIVTSADDFLYTDFNLIPFIFPFCDVKNQLGEEIIEFGIEKNSVEEIVGKFRKFGAESNPDLLEQYQSQMLRNNPLVDIENGSEKIIFRIVNPAYIYEYVRKVLEENPESKMPEYEDELFLPSEDKELRIDSIYHSDLTSYREENMKKHIDLIRESY